MASALSAGIRPAQLDLDPSPKPFHGRSLFTDPLARSIKLNYQSRRLPVGTLAYARASRPGEGAFETLGVGRGASEQDIKKAYRRLALQYHPDVCKGEFCTAKFLQISDAYETVMDFVNGSAQSIQDMAVETYPDGMMGVNDDSWEEWEEWMGWEGAGTRDYTSHINYDL